MKRHIIVALCLRAVAAAAVTAATLGATKKTTASSITVWLQVDAQSGWPTVVAAANKAFEQQNPGVTVNVQYQQWNTHLQKFDATLAGGNAPDVIEMGNSEMTKYMAAGAFADLTADKSKFPNSSTWLKGLQDSATYDGKLMGVPYYAGTRVVDLPHRPVQGGRDHEARRRASHSSSPTARRSARRTAPTRRFSPFYIAGKDWYSALALRLRLRRADRDASERQVDRHARPAARDRGAERVQEHVPRALEGEQVDRRGEPVPDHAVLAGPRGVVRRPRLAVRLRARPEGRQPEAQAGHGRVRDAEPHARQDDARRSSAAPISRSRPRARNKTLAERLDRRLHRERRR